MKTRSRLLALLLAAVMVMALFAACGGDDKPETTMAGTDGTSKATDTSSEATTPASETTPAETTVDYSKLKGYELTIANNGDVFPAMAEDGSYASQSEEELADQLADLEDRLDVTIEDEYLPGDMLEQLLAASMGGTKLFDLLWARQNKFWPAAKANAILPLDDPRLVNEGLDYTDETRWYQTTVRCSEMFGHPWSLNVASEYVMAQTGYFITFNKELCKSAGYDDMYQLVRDGKWTWDVYRDIAKKTTKDTNGDGTPDTWGTGATAWGNEIATNGIQPIGEVDGKWRLLLDTEPGIRALQFLYDMNYGDGTRMEAESSGAAREAFANGTVTFNWAGMGHINGAGEIIYNSEHDYGIIPMPKGPDATEYCSMHNNLDAFIIQSTNHDLDKVVPILNEWALILNDTESYLNILDDGRCRTEEDKEMMAEYIIPNFTVKISTVCPDANDLIGDIIGGVSYDGKTPKQAVEEYAASINAALDAFFEQ
ncbi:MAG: hypothetical protein DBY36_02505 [Clostridiales bacterium]|nr:MAG: hypothetical protein DBY36_05355 [Clostridiales bacterium]PWL54343.1 MAG: hypothetical protein DBY36_02505 [Clostridiales bacterium]